MRKLFISIFFFITIFLIPVPTFAQKVSLRINPAKVEIIAKPDQTILQSFEIQNSSDPVIATITLEPFEAKETDQSIQFDLENEAIKLNEPFFLRPNEKKTIELSLDIDLNTAQKDYYYDFILRSEPPPTSEGAISIRNSLTVGSRIFVTVTKDAKVDIKPKIILFSTLPRFKIFSKPFYVFDSADKIPFILKIANEGRNLIKPRGELVLRGLSAAKPNYSIVRSNILAQSEKVIPIEPSVLSGFFLGKYSLFASINFGQASPTIYSSTSFFVFPFKLTFLLLIAFVLFLIYRWRNR